MRMYQDTRRLDFHALGREIKRKREAKGWTQEYLAQLVDRTPRSIMYFENRGQHPSLNTFYQIVTLLDISVDQFFYPDRQNGESDCRQHIDRLLNTTIGLVVFLRDTPTSVGLPELEGTETRQVKTEKKGAEHKAFLMKYVFKNPLIWILGFANFFVYIVRFSVLDWGPSLLSQSKGVSMSHAGWLVAMFEIAGILGMLFAGWATDKWLKGRAHRTCVFCMAGAALFVFLFWQLPADAPIWLLFTTLCAAGFCIYGPQALIGIAAANQATKKAAATANGLTGLFGYASTLVSGVGLGFVAQHYGWNWAYVGILGMAVVGMLVFLLMWGAKADGYEPEAE